MRKSAPMLLCDFYKISHREQYPKGTEYVYSTWIPRTSRIEGIDHVLAFGFQGFIKKYLLNYFHENFFSKNIDFIIEDYKNFISASLLINKSDVKTDHIRDLYNLGHLPLLIKAVPEGISVPLRCPMLTIENTDPIFFWLTNFIETLMSCELWQPSTSATIANEYRKSLDSAARKTGSPMDFVEFQGHDFSMRGMGCLDAAQTSGAGHLLSFKGTDSIPAILYLEDYYNTSSLVGTSIPATEHSVMCSYGQDEYETFKRLITKVYPSGLISIVSDTWDFWTVLDDVVRRLADTIKQRPGKVVIRPDSGDPIKIICGDKDSTNELERIGAVELLWQIFGGTFNNAGYRTLHHSIGLIYGDAITLERCREICRRLEEKGFSSSNVVFGIGSYTYQYNTRDTFGFALKTTHVVINGKEYNIFKDPKTDKDSIKKSLTGRVAVLHNGRDYECKSGLTITDEADIFRDNFLRPIFKNGELLVDDSLQMIRSRINRF